VYINNERGKNGKLLYGIKNTTSYKR